MEIVNFICPFSSQEQKEAWCLLTNCAVCGFPYEQAKDYMEGLGIYLPRDQYRLLSELVNTQIDLDIGERQGENHIV